jgi:hypothetical protein
MMPLSKSVPARIGPRPTISRPSDTNATAISMLARVTGTL